MPYILSFILSCVIKKGQSFYKAVFFLPSVISLVVGSILYYMDSESDFGSGRDCGRLVWAETAVWSKTEGWVIAVLCIITTWKTFGYNFINILAGVSGVSMGDHRGGASGKCADVEDFRDIVVPMSSATGIYVFITTIVQGLQYVFTPIKVIITGRT